MKKTHKSNTNKLALAAIAGLCAFGSAQAIGVDAKIYANPQKGIGGEVKADVGLAKANVKANVASDGVAAEGGAEVIGVGANTAGHVGFDGVKGRANTYVGPFVDAGFNAGATWKDGVYAGASAHAFEQPNTAGRVLANGETLYAEAKPAPEGCAWVYGSNGRVLGYQPVPQTTTRYVQVQRPEQQVQYVYQYVPAQRTYRTVVRNPDVVYQTIRPRVSVSSIPAVESYTSAPVANYGVRQEVETFDGYSHKTRNSSTTYSEHKIYVNDPTEGYERREVHKRKVTTRTRVFWTYE